MRENIVCRKAVLSIEEKGSSVDVGMVPFDDAVDGARGASIAGLSSEDVDGATATPPAFTDSDGGISPIDSSSETQVDVQRDVPLPRLDLLSAPRS